MYSCTNGFLTNIPRIQVNGVQISCRSPSFQTRSYILWSDVQVHLPNVDLHMGKRK